MNINDYNNFSSFSGGEEEDVLDLNSFSSNNDKKPEKKEPTGFLKKLNKKNIIKIVVSLLLVCVITGSLIVGAFMVYAFGFVDATMEEDLDNLALNFTTTIYAKNDNGEFEEYQRIHGEFNRIWVSDKDGNLPDNLKNAFIAVEDRHFRDHQGVDWKRTFAAFANLFLKFYSSNQGGSTITQQLVKNLTGDNSRSPSRKIREIMRARDLESKHSKDTILECYLNTIAMGGGMYGVEVASNYYFGKSAKDLTLEECAALASIAKEPEGYRPDKNPKDNKRRRQTVLNLMLEQGFISEEQHKEAYDKELNIVASKELLNEDETNSYFVDALIEDVKLGLMKLYDFDEKHAANNLYNGGYKIYATVSPKVQEAVDAVFSNEKYALKGKDGKLLQGAMTVMDYEGHVLGLAGGIGKKEGNRVLNRAIDSPRQPGSTIKPLSAYTPAIENDLVTYSTIVNDTERYYKDWKPNNWYLNGGYYGHITIEYALERSSNGIPVYLVDMLTPQTSYDFLTTKLGFKHFNKNDIDYSPMGMGGSNGGTTTLEQAAAFAVYGNGGIYYEPITYYKVTDWKGNVVLENKSQTTVAISDDTATVMNHLLQNVVYGAEGTGEANRNAANGMRVYGKTGTSNETMNCWFSGGSPYYVASTWCGYDTQQSVSQSNIARNMWRAVMQSIHKGLPHKDYIDSSNTVSKAFCTKTGLLATEACPSSKTGWYKTSNVPTMCTEHPASTAPAEPDAQN